MHYLDDYIACITVDNPTIVETVYILDACVGYTGRHLMRYRGCSPNSKVSGTSEVMLTSNLSGPFMSGRWPPQLPARTWIAIVLH